MPSYSYLRRTGAFLSLSIKRVECADGVVEQGPIDLPLQLSWESGCKLDTTSLKTIMIAGSWAKKGFSNLGEVPLHKDLPAVGLGKSSGLSVCHCSALGYNISEG